MVYDLLSIYVVGFFTYPFIKYFETRDIIYLVFGISIIVVDYSTKAIKFLTKDLHEIFKRPVLATDCDIFCRNKECGGKPGFPSGHVTTMAFFTMFFYLKTKNMNFTVFNIISTALIALARYKKHCHNEWQIIAGTFYGIASGIILNKIINSYTS